MSYNLHIFKKNGSQKPFALKELEDKLHTVFDIFEYDPTHKDRVEWFVIHYFDKSPSHTWEFYYDKEKGCYWARCSYSTDKNTFIDFRKVVSDVAILLNMQIQDPQIDEKIIDPKNFDINDQRSIRARAFMIHTQYEIAMKFGGKNAYPSIESYCSKITEEKYFILYSIIARIPETFRLQYLVLDDGRFFASKVNKGETLTEVLNREVSELTGSNNYFVEDIADKYDSAPDRKGKYLPRTAVFLRVPYFNPDKVKTKYLMRWVDIQI